MEKHCSCTGLFWAARKEPWSSGDAGLEWAVFQLGVVLVMLKSFLSKLSYKVKLAIDTNRKSLWPKYGAQGASFPLVNVFLGVKCYQITWMLSFLGLSLTTGNKTSYWRVWQVLTFTHANIQIHNYTSILTTRLWMLSLEKTSPGQLPDPAPHPASHTRSHVALTRSQEHFHIQP